MKKFFFLLHFLIALGAYITQSTYENQCSKFHGDMSTRSWPFLGLPKTLNFDSTSCLGGATRDVIISISITEK